MSKNQSFNLLVVDDDPLIRESLPLAIPDTWELQAFAHPNEMNLNLNYHAALIDMHYGDIEKAEGLKVIETIHARHPHLEIIAMSGDLSRELMEKTLKSGASRFLAKPLNPDEVHLTLEKIESFLLLQRAAQRAHTKEVMWIGQSEKS
ncbi:MAG: response regulator, partial [Bdellovibrionales bacterium]|nr:response regulator [Bdellovibrionales bacterium]